MGNIELYEFMIARCAPEDLANAYVKYSDYEALEAKLLQVKHAYNQRLKPSFDCVDGNAVALGEDEIDRLEAKLAALERLLQQHQTYQTKQGEK